MKIYLITQEEYLENLSEDLVKLSNVELKFSDDWEKEVKLNNILNKTSHLYCKFENGDKFLYLRELKTVILEDNLQSLLNSTKELNVSFENWNVKISELEKRNYLLSQYYRRQFQEPLSYFSEEDLHKILYIPQGTYRLVDDRNISVEVELYRTDTKGEIAQYSDPDTGYLGYTKKCEVDYPQAEVIAFEVMIQLVLTDYYLNL